jgi:hypothetical protein
MSLSVFLSVFALRKVTMHQDSAISTVALAAKYAIEIHQLERYTQIDF